MSLSIKDVIAKVGKEPLELVVDGPINYIVMNRPYNQIDNEFIIKMNKILDLIDNSKEEPAVIITIGTGANCFCSGFDLKYWMQSPVNVFESLVGF